jgi:uncharacterized membrane protein
MTIVRASKIIGISFIYFILVIGWIKFRYTKYEESSYNNKWFIYAVISYILLVMNISFILYPLKKTMKTMVRKTLIFALSGFIIYGIVNVTTLSLMKTKNFIPAIIDTLWGIFTHIIVYILIELMEV